MQNESLKSQVIYLEHNATIIFYVHFRHLWSYVEYKRSGGSSRQKLTFLYILYTALISA